MKKQFGILFIFIIFIYKAEAQSLPLPYYTGFDSPEEKAGWVQFRLGFQSQSDWYFDNYPGIPSLPNCISHHYNLDPENPTDTIEDWYVSPPLKIISPSKISIKISLSLAEIYEPQKYIGIWLGSGANNDPAGGNFVELANLTNMKPEGKWLDTSININKFAYPSYIAFKYRDNNNWFIVEIDNVTISPDSGTFIIDKLKKNSVATIYPNPINGVAILEISDPLFSEVDAVIYDLLGQTVHSQTLNPKRETLNLNLSNGIYFYKVLNREKEIVRGKLIVQKP
ncbi:MAG: hypothetical protein A3H98_05150 [Bacteroidetes bacterium RIFCSPLOWO2_02_FULL_36_8]|nr:MAG: hypothetical protein A3H98_05150 [Bacteroidetes bacterium RIFCSPLOWO2_02_FULL_36_8]OFY70125.1 MAG: hypothetical protein A3G23_11855 [Bacteroidetes bacterium RIFCSPLOWO2_12_FULL_37_12]